MAVGVTTGVDVGGVVVGAIVAVAVAVGSGSGGGVVFGPPHAARDRLSVIATTAEEQSRHLFINICPSFSTKLMFIIQL